MSSPSLSTIISGKKKSRPSPEPLPGFEPWPAAAKSYFAKTIKPSGTVHLGHIYKVFQNRRLRLQNGASRLRRRRRNRRLAPPRLPASANPAARAADEPDHATERAGSRIRRKLSRYGARRGRTEAASSLSQCGDWDKSCPRRGRRGPDPRKPSPRQGAPAARAGTRRPPRDEPRRTPCDGRSRRCFNMPTHCD